MAVNSRRILVGWALTSFFIVSSAYGGKWKEVGPVASVLEAFGQMKVNLSSEQDLSGAPHTTGMIEENVPLKSFWKKPLQTSCTEIGVFPLADSCRDFYYCEDQSGEGLELSAFKFSCPLGTLFDDDKKKCLSAMSSKRPECKNETLTDGAMSTAGESLTFYGDAFAYTANSGDTVDGIGQILKRKKRSENICSKEMVDILASSAREACEQTHNIDVFIRDIKSKRTLQIALFKEEVYQGIIRNYNRDLNNAQNNYNEWRHGDSLFNALKETFLLAKQFEPKFNREFEENRKRVEEIANKHGPIIMNIEEDVTNLQNAIRDIEAVLNKAPNLPSNHRALTYMKNSLSNKQDALKKLITDEERVKAEKEVNELIVFLEFVRGDVAEIHDKAQSIAIKVEDFQVKIGKDSNVFLRHRRVTQEAIQSLQERKRSHENERTQIQNNIGNLQIRINQDSSAISRFRRIIENTESDLRSIERTIAHRQREAKKRQNLGAGLLAIPIFGWIAGGIILSEGIEEEKALANQRRNIINQYRSMVNSYYSQIRVKIGQIQHESNRISTLNKRLQTIETELSNFGNLDKDLASVQNDVNSILPSTNEALSSIGKMKGVFDSIKQKLEDIIDVAKSRKEKAEAKKLSDFIYYKITALKCKWDQASVNIVVLGNCN